MAKSVYYITTAIDYTNAAPHIGHAYEKVLADVNARYHRHCGREVFFLTGVDQHGQKVRQTAAAQGTEPLAHVKRITALFLDLWKKLDVCYDGWIETTDVHHKTVVRDLLQRLHDDGQIYRKSTHGQYSVRQEQFVTDRDRDPDGSFGEQWGEVIEFEEENYYFRLSDHVGWLRDYLTRTPDVIFPEFRKADVINALAATEGTDLCISRPKDRLDWGIELPFDSDYVTFVWFDALTNYISGAGYRRELHGADAPPLPDFDRLWPADAHVIGKDILVPAHAIYWMIMLHAAGFTDDQMPKFLVHGWWNIRGEKMSKTTGNIVDPVALADRYTTDGLRYYLLRDIVSGRDADFDESRLRMLYQTELANELGNLLNRTLNMTARYRGGVVTPGSGHEDADNAALRSKVAEAHVAYHAHMQGHEPHAALEVVRGVTGAANRYVEQSAPWKLAKDDAQAARLDSVLHHLAETLVHIAAWLRPFMPTATGRMLGQLQAADKVPTLTDMAWGLLPDGHVLGAADPLFPRLPEEEE